MTVDSNDMTPEERMEALASVLAEGFLYLAENGLLEEMGDGQDSGRKETFRNGAESPCFPSEDRLSFSPARRSRGESK